MEYDPKDLELLNWFSAASDDPEKRRFIFSPESFDKMAPFYGFNTVDANGSVEEVFETLRRRTRRLIDKA